jgi:hypothetical protein
VQSRGVTFWKKTKDDEAPPRSVAVVVRPCYRQFYLRRGQAAWRSDEISAAGYEQGLEEVEGFVYGGTAMYGSPTRLAITVHPSDPGARPNADRVAEVAITGDGDPAVLNWEPGEPAVASARVPTGRLLARIAWHGSDAAARHPDNDTGGDEVSPEHLTLDLWPAT